MLKSSSVNYFLIVYQNLSIQISSVGSHNTKRLQKTFGVCLHVQNDLSGLCCARPDCSAELSAVWSLLPSGHRQAFPLRICGSGLLSALTYVQRSLGSPERGCAGRRQRPVADSLWGSRVSGPGHLASDGEPCFNCFQPSL